MQTISVYIAVRWMGRNKNMHGAIIFLTGLFAGGVVGVAAMCLVQVTKCAECPQGKEHVSKDER